MIIGNRHLHNCVEGVLWMRAKQHDLYHNAHIFLFSSFESNGVYELNPKPLKTVNPL